MIRRLLHWLSFRHARRSPALLLLSLVAIALGVAVFVAIQVANRTVIRTFAATVDAVAGRATLEIAAGPGGLPDSLFLAVRRWPAVAAATPLIFEHALVPDHPGEVVELVGVDPLSNRPFAAYDAATPADADSNFLRLLADPRAALIPERMARDFGLAIGDPFPILIRSAPDTLRVAGLLHFSGEVERTLERILILDIAAAQEVTGKLGRIDRIDLLVSNPDSVAVALPVLPADALVRRPGARTAQIETLLRAFRLNLTALSLISLFVGTFLVYNAATTSVVRRRREIGILMALGTSRRAIQSLVLIEQLVLGAVGIAAGCVLGLVLARILLRSIAHTVSALYVQVFVRELFVEPKILGIAAAAGFAAVVVAAWFPAREAAQLAPQTVLTEGRRPTWRTIRPWRLLACGVLAWAIALALATSRFSARHPWTGFLAALCLLSGGALAAPATARALLWLVRPAAQRVPSFRLAAGELRTGLARSAVTIAALGSALAMVIGISIMITSFRHTVDLWIEQTVRADLYVTPASQRVAGAAAALDPEVIAVAEALPGVRAVDRLRTIEGLTIDGQPVRAAAVIFDVIAQESKFLFLAVDPALTGAGPFPPPTAALLREAARTGAVVVSEPLARRHRLTAGDTLRLQPAAGRREWRIAGVFRDYSSDAGLILFDLPTYARASGDSTVNSLALYLRDPTATAALRQSLLAGVGRRHTLLVRSNRDLREAALTEFDRTFAVTMTLKFITILTAMAGVFFSLTVGVTERRAELGLLRALGASTGQIRRMVLGEACLIGLAALAIGAATGVALALLLVFVVNPQFFGWTILWVLSPQVLLEAIAVVAIAALLAAWWPARAATRTDPARSLRAE
jgi:putative ABC transport system permease protein